MDTFSSVAEVQRKIRELEGQQKVAVSRLEKAEMMKKEGAHYYHGTELPIDDAIFSLKEGQVRSVQIALEFYRHTLNTLLPAAETPVPAPPVKASVVPAPVALPRPPVQGAPTL
ncbi:MAG: hypothetical protein MUC63_05270 [Planctomycetes bacterium]|jgi:hypothetical protein|nr:hypothetical protein [Planctomycetota bacterium]